MAHRDYIYFTGDTHFGHKNVIKYSNRPYTTSDEMDADMIDRWNQRITLDGHHVYHVGDFFMGKGGADRINEILDNLNGQIHLILGNHDRIIRNNKKLQERFAEVKEYKEITIDDPSAKHGKQMIVLLHYAMRVWNKSHYGAWHLYGHSHGSLPDDHNSLSIDVGVDSNNWYPISYENVKNIMSLKTFKPIDHHR